MGDKPNPGSDEAVKLGCACPVDDNNRGQGCGPWFYVSPKCPIHDESDAVVCDCESEIRALGRHAGDCAAALSAIEPAGGGE